MTRLRQLPSRCFPRKKAPSPCPRGLLFTCRLQSEKATAAKSVEAPSEYPRLLEPARYPFRVPSLR